MLSIRNKREMKKINKGGIYWKDVLHEIYISFPNQYGPGKIGWQSDDHLLAKMLGISGHELMLAMDFLNENGLLHTPQVDTINYVSLSKKGFDVAFQNEKIMNEKKTQNIIIFFTGIIAVATLYSFYMSLSLYQNSLYGAILLIGIMLIIVILGLKLLPLKLKNKRF